MSLKVYRYIKKAPFAAHKLFTKYVHSTKPPFLEGFERIYHVHLRKCAGTSLNSAFWNLAGLNLKSVGSKTEITIGGFVFVRNHKKLIEAGNYFFGNSHLPFWELNLPDKTFVFTMMRDPLSRLLSLHRYYRWIKKAHPASAIEKEPYYFSLVHNIGDIPESPLEFASCLKRKTLEPQLYAFSKSFEADEALQNLSKVNAVYFQDSFEEAVRDLNSRSGYNLHVVHERNFSSPDEKISFTLEELQNIKELLTEEYQLYEAAKKLYS